MKIRTKILIYLFILAVFDFVIPLPITAMILSYVLFQKPAWFLELVKDLYNRRD